MNIPQLDSTYIANTYARFPVTIARGKGSLVWDADDKVYIDMATGRPSRLPPSLQSAFEVVEDAREVLRSLQG